MDQQEQNGLEQTNREDNRQEPQETIRLKSRLWELALLFTRLGFTAFGGPAAHIAMYRQEVVERRKWLDDEYFLDLMGVTNLIPGPNSTELVMHLGYLRAKVPGLLVAGTSFILPAMTLVTALAWAYKKFGATPQADALLYGVKPAIIAIIVQALVELGRKALKNPQTAAAAMGVVALYFLDVNELILLAAGGLLVMLISNARRFRDSPGLFGAFPLSTFSIPLLTGQGVNLPGLFFTFVKIGSVLYGSGYVLLAFLRADFVERLGWLTNQQLIDAVAVGQLTPGPLFTTAAFIGYLLFDLSGAVTATIGIFLPSFILVTISNPFIPQLRKSPWTGALLDGVIAASLGLMAVVTWELGQEALIDPTTIGLALLSGVLLFLFNTNSAWLVIGGAALGLLKSIWF